MEVYYSGSLKFNDLPVNHSNENQNMKIVLFVQNHSFWFVIIVSPCEVRWSLSAEDVFFVQFLL